MPMFLIALAAVRSANRFLRLGSSAGRKKTNPTGNEKADDGEKLGFTTQDLGRLV